MGTERRDRLDRAIAVACAAVATPTSGTDLGRGLAIAAPPVAVVAAALAIGSRPRRATVVAVFGAVVTGPVRSLFDDPFLDAACVGCRHSAFALLASRPLGVWAGTAGALLLAAAIAAMVRRSTHRLLMTVDGALALALLPVAGSDPVVLASAGMTLAIAAAIATAVQVGIGRRRLAELERGLRNGASGTELLRRATADPGLTVDFVDRDDAGPGLPVLSGSRRVATVFSSDHDRLRPLLDPPAPALIVALAGERLDGELLGRVRELRASRSRVVVRADEQRRRLERDLHDGAQQYVLALGFDLRAALVKEDDVQRREVLESCVTETMHALDDLRDIAHGVYPPLLALAGLAPALRSLGTRTPAPITLGDLPGRLPSSVERLAYLLVSELAHDSVHAIDVSGSTAEGRLRLVVLCAGSQPSALLRERIAALDGTLALSPDAGGGDRWELDVPFE